MSTPGPVAAPPRWWATDAVRGAARTFIATFLGVMIPGVLGWLHALTEWASAQGQQPFPEATSLGYLGVTAITAAAASLVTLIWRGVENTTGKGLLRTVPKH